MLPTRVYTLHRTTRITATLDQAWRFFSDPRNLEKITPPELDLRVIGQDDVAPEVYPGMMLRYRVHPLLGIPMTWLTEITHVRAPHFFVDEQRVGPYGIWHHEHFFREIPDALEQVEIEDLVHYALPFSIFGMMGHPWLVKPQLEKIFNYREECMPVLFPPESGND